MAWHDRLRVFPDLLGVHRVTTEQDPATLGLEENALMTRSVPGSKHALESWQHLDVLAVEKLELRAGEVPLGQAARPVGLGLACPVHLGLLEDVWCHGELGAIT